MIGGPASVGQRGPPSLAFLLTPSLMSALFSGDGVHEDLMTGTGSNRHRVAQQRTPLTGDLENVLAVIDWGDSLAESSGRRPR